jgi:hypothetical protein
VHGCPFVHEMIHSIADRFRAAERGRGASRPTGID